MVQLSTDQSVDGRRRGDANQSGVVVGRGLGSSGMTQSTTQLTGSGNINSLNLQQNSNIQNHPNPHGNGNPAKGYANGDVVRNGFPSWGVGNTPTGRNHSSAPTPDRSSSSATSRPPDYPPRPSARMRMDRGGGGGERPRDRRVVERDSRDRADDQYATSRDRWSYYGDPRVRADQQFLRDRDERRGGFRDDGSRRDNNNRDRRDRRDPRDDRRRPPEADRDRRDDRRRPPETDHRDVTDQERKLSRDPEIDGGRAQDRYLHRNRDVTDQGRKQVRDPEIEGEGDQDPSRDRDVTDQERPQSRDPEIDGGRDQDRYSPRDRDRNPVREIEADGGSIVEERQQVLITEENDNKDQEAVGNDRSEPLVERDDDGDHERASPHGHDRDQNRDRDRHRGQDYRRDRDQSYERRRRRRDYDRERDRSYERERARDRDLGRDRDHQPLRREPVGEETGYDSDHSRMSRSTAVSFTTRSLGRRPRADSVASHVSMASHVSGRPPTIPGRTPRGGARGYDESYGSRELYDQYQYYYQYYRDHPYYKEYYRQWMKQYGQAYPSHESFYDDRTSIHSGRSSVNDELKKSISSQFMQDFHGRSSVGPYEPSAIYPDGSYAHLKSYASGELSGVPSVGGDSTSEAPQRLTPVQFGRPHINAQFTPGGQLILVLPKDPRDGEKAVVQLRDVQKMLCLDPSLNRCVQQMKSYPGPLTLADTHKDVVIRYCEQQAVEAAKNQSLPDRESVTLIWEYLALLVKQNGKLYGSDVAGLLLKGQDMTSQPETNTTTSQFAAEDVPDSPPSDASPQDEGIDLHSQTMPLPPPRDESALLKKFTEYLCLGRKKEAVDYAMREGLWGHALALSYKMDSTTHTRVLGAFSNSIPRNNVLLTLFQQLSGKRPEVAKNYAPHHWGSWQQHLAMMVSNPTGHNQRDRASIVSLGETLASRGQLHAAHFCYLVAEAEWGCFSNKESKLVLIGSSHQLPFQTFSTNEAIQCTEIFEFARSLDTNNPVLEKFQSYKLIYALRLTEFGFPSESLRYCEVISQIVSKNPNLYQGDFLAQVYELASRLKYHDLHYQMCEGEITEMPDPQWLINLCTVVDTVKQQEAEQLAAQAPKVPQTSEAPSQDYYSYNQGYPAESYQGSNSTPDLYPQPAKNASETYQQGYGVGDTSYQQSHGTPDPHQQQSHGGSGDGVDGSYHQQPHVPTHPITTQGPEEGSHTPVNVKEVSQSNDGAAVTQENSSPQTGGNMPVMMQPMQDQSQYASYGSHYWPGYMPQDPNTSSQYMQPNSAETTHSSLPPTPEVSSDQRANSVASMSQPNSLSGYPTPPHSYQAWDQQQQLGSSSATDQSQSRSPESAEASHRTPEEEAYWAEMTGKKTSKDASETNSKEMEKMEDDKKRKDKDSDGSQDKNSGWSIGSLFGWKKSKQAVLPDDKNPTIVWNEEKRRWENKDGGEEVHSPPPPPPKSVPGGPGAPPVSMTRGGPRMSRYVNTEKDSTKQPPNSTSPMLPPMASTSPASSGPPMSSAPPIGSGPPVMPSGPPVIPSGPPVMPSGPAVMPSGPPVMPSGPPVMPSGPPMMPSGAPMPQTFMVPGSLPQLQEGDRSSPQQPEQQPQQPSLQQIPPTAIPDSSLGTSNDGAEGAVPMMGHPGQPQFFNPSQFNQTTASKPSQPRRVGPGKRLYQGKR